MSWTIILDHLFMVLAASTLAIIIGIPLGILAYMYPKTKAIILNLVDILQTIPALALLGLIMIVAGAGKTTVVLGIMLYSLLPIARNTYLGLSEIDPGIKEAAKGVGMTGFERLTKVEFPIAYPTIFTGIRIAIVNAIGIAVFAAFVGGGGIGNMMYQAIRVQDMGGILLSTAVLMVIAVVLLLPMTVSSLPLSVSTHDFIFCVVIAGILSSGIGYMIEVRGLIELGTTISGVYINLLPVFTAAAGVLFLNETMSALQVFGSLLVIACSIYITLQNDV